MIINEDECEKAGLDINEVRRIAKGLSRYGKQAQKLGMLIFGGSGTGELRYRDDHDKGALKLVSLVGSYDGGDGGDADWGDGFIRGE